MGSIQLPHCITQPGGNFIFQNQGGTASPTDTVVVVAGDSHVYLRVRGLWHLEQPMKAMKSRAVSRKIYSQCLQISAWMHLHFSLNRLPHSAHYTLKTTQYTLHTLHCTLHTAHWQVWWHPFIILQPPAKRLWQCRPCKMHWTLNTTVNCTLIITNFTLKTAVKWTVYTDQYQMHTKNCILYISCFALKTWQRKLALNPSYCPWAKNPLHTLQFHI